MEGPCDERHTPAHSVMEVPMDVEDGAADISVADNLFGTSVTAPNLSVGTLGSLSEGLLQSHAWPLVRLFAVQRMGERSRCARAAPSPSAAQGPCPQDCPLQTPSADGQCPAVCPAAPTSGFNERHQVSTVLALPCLFSELYLTG